MSIRFTIMLAGLCAAFPPFTQAATTVTDHDNIIITATRLDDSEQAAGYVTVISAEQIHNSTAETLPDLLATEAGIQSRSLYGNQAARSTLDLRGFGAAARQNTLILLDGRRLNDIDLSAVDFAAIPLASIERIEIIRGGGSVLYGDGASGGVINIISKQSGEAAVSNVALSAGAYRTRHLDLTTSSSLASSHVSGALTAIKSDGYRDNNDLTQYVLNLALRTPQTNGDWFAHLGLDKQELGLPGVRVVDPGSNIDELESDRDGTSTPNDYARQKGAGLTAGITRYLSETAELVADIGFRGKNQRSFFDYGGGFSDYLDSTLSTWSFTPRLTLDHSGTTTTSSSTIFGLDVYLSDYDSDRALSPDTISRPIHRLAITQDSTALYVSNDTRLGKQTSVSAGARWQRLKQTASDRYDATAPGASDSEAPDYAETYEETMWQLGLRRRLGATTTVFGNLERAVRFATVDELYEYDALFQRIFSPLRPQTADQLNVGIEYTTAAGGVSGNIFYMNLAHEIHYDPVTFANINLDRTRRQGLELSMHRAMTDALHIRASYTRVDAEFRDGVYAGNSIPLVAKNTAGLTAVWQIQADTQLSTRLNYVGSRYFDNDQGNDFGQKIPAHTTLDLKLVVTHRPWSVETAVNNALNEKYYDYGVSSTTTAGKYNAYPNPERNVNLSVARSF